MKSNYNLAGSIRGNMIACGESARLERNYAYDQEPVRHLLKNRQEMHFCVFWPFLSLGAIHKRKRAKIRAKKGAKIGSKRRSKRAESFLSDFQNLRIVLALPNDAVSGYIHKISFKTLKFKKIVIRQF